MIVTVITTGFTEQEAPLFQTSSQPSMEGMSYLYQKEQRIQLDPINREEPDHYDQHSDQQEKSLDIPTFLSKRKK